MIRIIRKAVRYRERHIWHLDQAAKYRTGLRFSQDDELAHLIIRGIKLALETSQDEMKCSLLSSPFDDAASEIDFDGPEFPINLVQSRRGEARHSGLAGPDEAGQSVRGAVWRR